MQASLICSMCMCLTKQANVISIKVSETEGANATKNEWSLALVYLYNLVSALFSRALAVI